MKNTTKLYKKIEVKALISAAVVLAFATPLVTADDDYEWDPTWGYHEEEWYDPSDWFNEDGAISYEDPEEYGTDYWGADYDDTYYGDTWYDTYDYEDTGYTWDADEQTWANGGQDDVVSYVVYTIAVTPEEQQRRQQQMAQNERGQQGRQQQARQDREDQPQAKQQGEDQEKREARDERKRDKKKRAQRDERMKGRPLAETTVTGTIDGFRKMNLRQTPESKPIEQTLARVNLENGNTWIVALGDKKVMRKMKPESGDTIEVSGVRAMIDGKPAIIAGSITIDGKTMNIDREAAENIAFTGTIDDYGKARLSGKKKPEHLVLSLMLEDGSDRGIVVDFGPNTNMEDLKLESGKQITVVGRKAQIGEKSVLVAQQFEVME